MNWIREANYKEDMEAVVEPYVAARTEAGTFERIKGQKIYYEAYIADKAKGAIVLSHGFTESVRKFTESVYYMLQAGYNVYAVDHRGHGRSYRPNDNPYVVHAEKFEDYVLDLEYFTREIVKREKKETGPLYLYGHSMGGCIGAWTIETYPDLFKKAVLTSPMLALKFPVPTPIMVAGASLIGMGKGGRRKKEPLSPVNAFTETPDFENSCDSSKCRYLYYFDKRLKDSALQTTSPSVGWGLEAVKACKRAISKAETAKIRIPVLLMQAGNDTMVDNAGQVLFASRVPSCTFTQVPGMKHELYMTDSDVLIPYWEKIFAFLG